MTEPREQDGWPDAEVTERLLSGADVVESDDERIAQLARLLALAGELPAGRPEDERTVLAAFRQQRDSRTGRGTRTRSTLRKVRPAKAVIGGVAAVLALGGVAIAAQNGALVDPFGWGGPAVPGPGTNPSTHGTHSPTPSSPSAAGAAGTSAPPSQQFSPHPAPTTGAPVTAAVKGLCESYVKATQQGRTLNSLAQERLEQAAGGSDEVAAYCARLIGTTVSHGKSSATSSATHPTPAATRRK